MARPHAAAAGVIFSGQNPFARRKVSEHFMKKLNSHCLAILIIFFFSAFAGIAKAQTITLVATNGLPSSYNFSTNQIIMINSFISSDAGSAGSATISFNNGLKTQIGSYYYGLNRDSTGGSGALSMAFTGNAVFTGVTNISVVTASSKAVAALTFTITTPTVQSYIPANAVVIPTDATGPVQIILESSSDLMNWTSSLPGTYGSTYTNRFFRVRAIVQ
jgi:hypothetical protein